MQDNYTYVYILKSKTTPPNYYTGRTKNLTTRLKAHNTGKVKSTTQNRPWKIQTALAFTNHQKAIKFEQYLKSHSGRAFATKRF